MTAPLRTARLWFVVLLLAASYAFAMWQPVRDVYRSVDKLAHAGAFFLVYGALVWALEGWPAWRVALLAAALGGAVELQQWFVPRFTASWEDWLADLVGIGAAFLLHGLWRLICRAATEETPPAAPPGLLPDAQFRAAIEALPLVSIDWVLSDPAGSILVGERLNAPARGAWFTPGGRVRKGERLEQAKVRIAMSELGVPEPVAQAWAARGVAMGAWDHVYPDSALDEHLSTHYVNLPMWLPLTEADIASLRLPVGGQHRGWAWLPVAGGDAGGPVWHAYVQPYADWVRARLDAPTAWPQRPDSGAPP